MSEESQLKTELVKQCKTMGWYARRIEDQFAVGILDIVIVPHAYHTLFVEAKLTDGLIFRPTERQYLEGYRIIEAGGFALPILIGWRQEVMYIADWSREAFVTRAFKQPEKMNYAQTIQEWIHGKQRGN